MADQKLDNETANDIDLLQDVIRKALKAGADAADAVLVEGTSLSHARRLGKTEKLERSEGQDLGLRVLVGKQQAIVSSSGRAPRKRLRLRSRALPIPRALKPAGADRALRSPLPTGSPAGIAAHTMPSAPRSSAGRATPWSGTTISPTASTAPICSTRPRSAGAPASGQSAVSARARCRTAAARSCSIRASRAASSRICWGRFQARRSRAARASCETSCTGGFSLKRSRLPRSE